MIVLPDSTTHTGAQPSESGSHCAILFTRKDRPADLLSVWATRCTWLAVVAVAVFAMALHVRFVTHVGGLWRDEANSVQLATLPTFGEVCHNLEFDSFPILYLAVLRGWTGIFGTANDSALRALGLIIGLTIPAVLWLNARSFGARWPMISLALIGLNPMIIRYGDSTRAYGLGMILILLTFRSFWRLAQSSSSLNYRKILSAAALAVLSVQCLYYNSVLLVAIAAAAIVVAARERAWRTIAIVLAIGTLAALSLLPYVPMMQRKQAWTFLVSYPVTLPWLWRRACEVIGSPDPVIVWIWTGLFITSLGVGVLTAILHLPKGRAKPSLRLPAPILFAVTTVIVAVPAYALFLRALGYYTQPWYYIALFVLIAGAFDVVFGVWHNEIKGLIPLLMRTIPPVMVLLLFSLAALPAWEEMPTRHTNVDLVAAQLKSQATKGDLVVATHWQYAVSLYRYYHGPATVITLPFVEDHRFHRYDLALKQMQSDYPLEPAFTRIGETLQSGHRVFFLGALRFLKAGELPPGLSLGYRDANGSRHGGNYDVVWPISAGYFVQTHAKNCVQIPVPVPNRARVQRYEYLALSMAEGWR